MYTFVVLNDSDTGYDAHHTTVEYAGNDKDRAFEVFCTLPDPYLELWRDGEYIWDSFRREEVKEKLNSLQP